jgi:hypothetical protein
VRGAPRPLPRLLPKEIAVPTTRSPLIVAAARTMFVHGRAWLRPWLRAMMALPAARGTRRMASMLCGPADVALTQSLQSLRNATTSPDVSAMVAHLHAPTARPTALDHALVLEACLQAQDQALASAVLQRFRSIASTEESVHAVASVEVLLVNAAVTAKHPPTLLAAIRQLYAVCLPQHPHVVTTALASLLYQYIFERRHQSAVLLFDAMYHVFAVPTAAASATLSSMVTTVSTAPAWLSAMVPSQASVPAALLPTIAAIFEPSPVQPGKTKNKLEDAFVRLLQSVATRPDVDLALALPLLTDPSMPTNGVPVFLAKFGMQYPALPFRWLFAVHHAVILHLVRPMSSRLPQCVAYLQAHFPAVRSPTTLWPSSALYPYLLNRLLKHRLTTQPNAINAAPAASLAAAQDGLLALCAAHAMAAPAAFMTPTSAMFSPTPHIFLSASMELPEFRRSIPVSFDAAIMACLARGELTLALELVQTLHRLDLAPILASKTAINAVARSLPRTIAASSYLTLFRATYSSHLSAARSLFSQLIDSHVRAVAAQPPSSPSSSDASDSASIVAKDPGLVTPALVNMWVAKYAIPHDPKALGALLGELQQADIEVRRVDVCTHNVVSLLVCLLASLFPSHCVTMYCVRWLCCS